MCESFGARLRQRREEQGIALSSIAEQTKIKMSLLEALERDDVSRWPSGIFRRAFVRSYGLAIGLQPDAVVREFLDNHPDPLEEVVPVGDAPADAGSAPVTPPMRLRYLVGAAVGSLARLRSGGGHKRPADDHAALNATDSGRNLFVPHTNEIVGVSESIHSIAAMELADDAGLVDVAEADEPVDSLNLPESLEARLEFAAPAAPEAPPEIDCISDEAPSPIPVFEPDLVAAASLCAELSRIDHPREVAPLLEELARVLDALGVIVWLWDPQAAALTPALPHGYSDAVLAQLPNLACDARNATAAAFRSAQTCIVSGGDAASDALVIPLLTSAGCTGVLAIELQNGGARSEPVKALATILAAQLARAVGSIQPAMAANRRRA
jgi:transcriptional regulator with XRE-family HTH domain